MYGRCRLVHQSRFPTTTATASTANTIIAVRRENILMDRDEVPATLSLAVGMADVTEGCLSVNAERKPNRKPSRHPNTAEKSTRQAIDLELGYVGVALAQD